VQQFLDSVRRDGLRVAEVVARAPNDAVVRACPGWVLSDLAQHLGRVHRWVIAAVETREQPHGDTLDPPPATGAAELAAWVADGVERLVALLASLPPDAPTWHPFAAPQVVAVWPRRQAQETMVHRWDAEDAAGDMHPLDPVIAADGILEYFQLIVPRVVQRDGRTTPKGVLHIECTDVDMTCTVTSGAAVDVELGDGVAAMVDGRIRGTAENVLLALWGRRPLAAGAGIEQSPAPSVSSSSSSFVADWLRFGGN
jgi:uncharacterized protein (TIGR03083 family)